MSRADERIPPTNEKGLGDMLSFEREMLASIRMNERLADAERERLARLARGARVGRRGWRAGVAISLVRRLVRVAQAS
jgi:hypothetical protein